MEAAHDGAARASCDGMRSHSASSAGSSILAFIDNDLDEDGRVITTRASASSGSLLQLLLLAFCWACSLTTACLLASVGPLAAKALGAPDTLSPLAIGVCVGGSALISVPSHALFTTCGRRGTFLFGSALNIAAGGVGVAAVFWKRWEVVIVACFVAGLSQGLAQYYRFAAVELCDPSRKAFAVTLVLSGGVVAAFAGPELAGRTSNIVPEYPFLGSFASVALISVVNTIAVAVMRFPKHPLAAAAPLAAPAAVANTADTADTADNTADTTVSASARGKEAQKAGQNTASSLDEPLLAAHDRAESARRGTGGGSALPSSSTPVKATSLVRLMCQPQCVAAIVIATSAYTAMIMLMSPLAIAMEEKGFDKELTLLTFELHFFAMFAPGFFTGHVIDKLGPLVVSGAGVVLFAAAAVTMVTGQALWNFMVGMIFCGVSWNFLFSSATVMLTDCYNPADATKVQAVNDFVIFFVSAVMSCAMGVIFEKLGWTVVVYIASAVILALAAVLPVFVCLRRRSDQQSDQQSDQRSRSGQGAGGGERGDGGG